MTMSTDPSRWRQYTVRELTVAQVLARQARERGSKIYLRDTNGLAMTYAEVHEATNRIANWLANHGLGRGAHVAVMMDNERDCLLSHIALAKLGAVSIPINSSAQGGMLAHYINSSDAVAVIASQHYAERLIALETDIANLQALIIVGDWTGLPSTRFKMLSFIDSSAASEELLEADVKFSDLAFIMFTSGTTGPSKGVMFVQARAFFWDQGAADELGLSEADTYFVCTPLSHAAGLFSGAWLMMALGGTVALAPGFSARQFWSQVRATGATFSVLVGAMVSFLEAVPERDDDADNPMRLISAGPYPKNWREFERRFGVHIVSSYGLSDHSTPTKLPLKCPDDKRGSAGLVIDGFEMLIVDNDDMPLPAGQIGECLLRARYPWHSSSGYYKQPEQTAASRRNDWFHTGDRGYLDRDGYFWFVDRAKDVIRRRGENISAFEVEQFAGSHPAIAEIAAFPLRADEMEDEVAISIVLKPGVEIEPGELIRYCGGKMSAFMIPRFIHITDQLPRNLNQRVEKYKLREWMERNRDKVWDSEKIDEFRRKPRGVKT